MVDRLRHGGQPPSSLGHCGGILTTRLLHRDCKPAARVHGASGALRVRARGGGACVRARGGGRGM